MAKNSSEKGRIDVIVRKRPLNELEISRGDKDIVVCNHDSGTIREFKCKIDGTSFIEEHEFKVDRFYDESADNHLIYNEYVKPLVESAFWEKKTCSCFTYGQTGSGKTFTMIGSRITKKNSKEDSKVVAGIYEYAANDIYRIIKEPEFEGKTEVFVSFYEIYCGKLYDLLQNRKLLESLDNGKKEVVIRDLSVRKVTSKEELMEHMLEGLNLRKIGQNSQNDVSSRSHAILRIELKNKETDKIQGGIVFIDLAGSERAADSITMCKQMQVDGAGINRSLLALKECIRSMDLEKMHIPFRNSELTKVLRDVFMGRSRNLMIANICPSVQSCEQTLNTLRYASKVKNFRSNSNNTCTNHSNSLSNFSTFDSNNINNHNIRGNTNKSYNRFTSMPSSKINNNNSNTKYLQYLKSPLTSKFVRDSKRSTPRSSNSPSSKDFKNFIEKMDLDATTSTSTKNNINNNNNNNDNHNNNNPDSNFQTHTDNVSVNNTVNDPANEDVNMDSETNISPGTKPQRTQNMDIVSDSGTTKKSSVPDMNLEFGLTRDYSEISAMENILKSHCNSTLNNIASILESIELKDVNKSIYNYLTSSPVMSTPDLPDLSNDDPDSEDHQYREPSSPSQTSSPFSETLENPETLDSDDILRAYSVFTQVSSLLRLSKTSGNPFHDVMNKIKIEFKLLLYLKELIDQHAASLN